MFILNFFENNQLLGLKKLQFDNWKSDIISNYNINSSAQMLYYLKYLIIKY